MSDDIDLLCEQVERLLDRGDDEAALPLLTEIAESGDAWGQYMLGLAYHYGNGVRRSRVLAAQWYDRAAAQGYDSAILNRGLLYASERPPAWSKAYRCFQRAARSGNRNAMFNLGIYYELGRHVKVNRRTSFKWYLKAAELGDNEAQCQVGYCYHEGRGVRKNDERAVHWYRRSASQKNGVACHNLGLCHRHGDGVERNQTRARSWFRKAVKYGHEKAKRFL